MQQLVAELWRDRRAVLGDKRCMKNTTKKEAAQLSGGPAWNAEFLLRYHQVESKRISALMRATLASSTAFVQPMTRSCCFGTRVRCS